MLKMFSPMKRYLITNELEFFGDTCLDDFLNFMLNHNKGHSICLAHNASGYDTRLLFNSLTRRASCPKLEPLLRGGKFMELKVNKKLVFRDSMLHIPGSLKRLAVDFLGPNVAQKGFFPHLFNSVDNYSYVGPIVPKDFFDASYFSTEQDWQEFNDWYDSYSGDWNFMEQLKLYCRNDVHVLALICKAYDEICMDLHKISPWKSMTSASYGHKISKRHVTLQRELDPKNDDYPYKIDDLAWNSDWAVLKSQEYYMVRNALRGGRTDIRRIYCELTQEEIDRGCKIVYQDLVSQYPYEQVVHDFPVGLPTMHIFDSDYVPCKLHQDSAAKHCDCPLEVRYKHDSGIFKYILEPREWTAQEMLDDPEFHGYICASVTPPTDLFHPVLVTYSDDDLKCTATCEPIVRGYFTTVEFRVALEMGYVVDKLFRFDRYKMKESFWVETTKPFFLGKMANSRNAPQGQELEQLLDDYEKFDMRDMMLKSIENGWGKNPAKKQTFKIMMNSGWGKHAQRPVLPSTLVVDYLNNPDAGYNFFLNLSNKKFTFNSTITLKDDYFMYRFLVDGQGVKIKYNNGYLPAAAFVPAYGRIHLWTEMNKLGKRVLMNDTDSIVYIYDPLEYNIPESDVWGGWEIEHDHIKEFVGLGPKTYGIKKMDGSVIVKNKGIRMTRATSKLVNYESMKKLVLDGLESGAVAKITVPQTLFKYNIGKNIETRRVLKDLNFSIRNQKGVVSQDGIVFPRGYDASDFVIHNKI